MHTLHVSFMTRTKRSYLFHAKVAHLREPKTVLDSVSNAVIPGTRFQNLCRRNLDSGSNRKWGFGFLTLSCGFQSLGFRIRKIKFYGFQILQATIFQIPESGFLGDKRLNVFDVRPLSATLGWFSNRTGTSFDYEKACLRADVSYFLCCTRKRDVCVTPSLIVFQRPAGRVFYFA